MSPLQPISTATSLVPSPVFLCEPISNLPALNETAEERSKYWSDADRTAFVQRVRLPIWSNCPRLDGERHAAIKYFVIQTPCRSDAGRPTKGET